MMAGARGFQEGGIAVRSSDRRFPRHTLAHPGHGASGDGNCVVGSKTHDAGVTSRQDVCSGVYCCYVPPG